MAEDKKLDSLLERVYQDGVEKSNKKAEEIISNAKSEADKLRKPRILVNVPVRPINSTPRLSKNIFLDTKDKASVTK